MRNHRVSTILLRAALGVFVLAVLAAFVAPATADAPSVGNLIFGDNFTLQSPPSNDINTDITWSGRVSGPLAGVISYDSANAVGTQTMDGDTFNMAAAGDYPRVGLTYDFSGNVAAGGIKISYDTNPPPGYNLSMLLTGCSSSAIPAFADTSSDWNAWLMRGLHYWEYPIGSGTWYEQNWLIYGNYAVSPGLYAAGGSTGVDFTGALHHVDIVCTDATDARPFNGAGTLNLDYYIDGDYVASYFGDDYYSNYIGLQAQTPDGSTYAQYDNLEILGNNLMVDTTVQWQDSVSQNWTDPTSWTTGAVPNGQDAVARFLANAMTVHVDTNVTVGGICMMGYWYSTIDSTGGKITLSSSSGNAQIQSWDGTNTISADIDLMNDLDLAVGGPYDILALSGTINVPGDPVNVIVNSVGTYGTVTVYGNLAPGGAVTVNNGVLDMYYGSTLTAASVAGNGTLHLEGNGILQGSPAIDIDVLQIDGDYTVGTVVEGSGSESLGNSITVGEVNGYGYLTLNGGTLVSRRSGDIVAGGLSLFTVAAGGGIIDINGSHDLAIKTVIQGDGALTITDSTASSGGTLWLGQNSPDWSGGLNVTNSGYAVVVYGDFPQGLGTGPVNVASGSALMFWGGATDIQVENAITLNGPGNYPLDPYGAALALRPGVADMTGTFTGTLTVHNDSVSGEAPDACCWQGMRMVLGGIITDGGGENPVGGLQIGNANSTGYYVGGVYTISGSESNDYRGDTTVRSGTLYLNKDPGKIAIPSANLIIGAGADAIDDARVTSVVLKGDNQINPDVLVTLDSPVYDGTAPRQIWSQLALNGHTQTVRGLNCNLNSNSEWHLNIVQNSDWTGSVVTEAAGALIINTQDGDDFTYSGLIGFFDSTYSMSLVKDGPGTQRFVPGLWGPGGLYTYTLGTTVKDGTLDVSAVGAFTPGSQITLEGGTLVAGNELSGPVSRGTTSGTLEAGGTTYTSLTLSNTVDIGAAMIDAGHTLTLTHSGDVIDTVTGASDSVLQVTAGASLTSSSITVGSLTIGGALAPAPVPEPSAVVLLALAGLAVTWYRSRKKS